MSRGNKWIPMDQYLAQDLKLIKGPFSRIEAMYSYTLDQDKGIKGTIAGYSTLWGWSRNKVRHFVNCIRTDEGHIRDRKRTHEGHPIHFIDKALMGKKDRSGTGRGQVGDRLHDTTIHPNPNKEIYSRVILYLNRKTGKNFQESSKKTQSLINARIKEGAKPDDFKTVIDNKTNQWAGTEDEKYLRPHTLFGNKFEGYLNEKPVNGKALTPEEILEKHGL